MTPRTAHQTGAKARRGRDGVGTSPRAGVVETRVYVLVDTRARLQDDHELFMRPADRALDLGDTSPGSDFAPRTPQILPNLPKMVQIPRSWVGSRRAVQDLIRGERCFGKPSRP